MAFQKLWVIAYRDLGRNRRRTVLTMLAVTFGLAILIMMSGYIAGVMDGALQNSIRLKTGHVQMRADSYEEAKMSLLWRDLLENTGALTAQAESQPQVQAASPVLWASGILTTIDDTVGVGVTGIDPASSIHDPIREGIVAGQFLSLEDRGVILVGKRLADNLGLEVGQRISLTVPQSDGSPQESVFQIAGIFSSGVPAYDETTIYMTLPQAQAFTGSGERASAIVIMLKDENAADQVAAALESPGIQTLTWQELHELLLQIVQTGLGFYYLMYGIVIMVVAVIIMNTLLMAVFERTREMGILAALGMKGRQIMLIFLLEATILSLVGIAFGIALGGSGVFYLEQTGIPIGDAIASQAGEVALGTVLYTKLVPQEIIGLAIAMLIIVLLVSLYPAWFAARMEPVKALHSL